MNELTTETDTARQPEEDNKQRWQLRADLKGMSKVFAMEPYITMPLTILLVIGVIIYNMVNDKDFTIPISVITIVCSAYAIVCFAVITRQQK